MLDKTYPHGAAEGPLYDRWEAGGAFASDPQSNRSPFTVMMPPPNVTGSLHMGHALNMTLQDVLTRYHRRRRRDALWQPGTDHAGIATQMIVERQLEDQGTSRREIGRDAFIDRVWEWKAQSGGAITRQLRRLGCSPDWQRERFTMDEGLSRAVTRVFVTLYGQGLIYKDKRLVNWDPKLQTAISDVEVEQRDINGHLWHLRYPLAEAPDQFITVATTRPETMLGDTAVAVHPDDARYQALIGKTVALPLTGRTIPIIADSYSDPEKGSGAVKITPAHDFNDFEVGRRHDLPMINIFDHRAHLNDAVPEVFRGLERYDARRAVVEALEVAGLVDKIERHRHAVPHGDRGGVPVEPWLTDQWYCDAATLARPAIEAVEDGRTRIVPRSWEKTYFDWMRNIQPWCISRQLWWGHRIPAWYGPDGAVFVAEQEGEAAAQAERHYGRAVDLTRDEDVLDTWFSSALWPFSTLGWPDETRHLARYYPGDVLITGFDIIFYWVARMMMMGLKFMDDVPFHTVYIHALVRDEKGQKMSKSKGNVIDPLDLADKYGADSLRFTLLSMAAQGRDIKLSEKRVEGYRNFTTKLWNAARFCQHNGCAHTEGFDPSSVRATVNRWIVDAVRRTALAVDEAMAGYHFNEAANGIFQFAWGTFCDWYLEFTKPILAGDDEALQAETRATTAWALVQILSLLNPMMPFVSEELSRQLGWSTGEGLINLDWPEPADWPADAAAAAEMEAVIRLITTVRTIRSEMNVPPSARLAALIRDPSPQAVARVDRHRALILRLARLSRIDHVDDLPGQGAAHAFVDEAELALPLADFIDLDKERSRLRRELEKIDKDIAKIDRKLSNKDFLAKAPGAVVEEQRERLTGFRATRTGLQSALDRVASA